MSTPLNKMTTLLALLHGANPENGISIKEAFIRAAKGPQLDDPTESGFNNSPYGKPLTINTQDEEHLRTGEKSAEEILLSSALQGQIMAWATRDQEVKDAWANSNVGFFDFLGDFADGVKAIVRGPIERVNEHLADEDKVQTQADVEKKKRDDAEQAKKKAEEEEKKKDQPAK